MAQNVFLKEPAATKVQIVNEDGTEVVKAEIENLPFSSNGSSVMVQISGLSGTSTVNVRPSGSGYIVQLDNILLLQSDGTFVPISLNSQFIGINSSQLTALLTSYKTAYSTLVAGVTSATLHYSTLNNSGVVTSEVYNLKD